MTTVFVVPHTHWDREWYETASRFRQRLVPVVDEIIDLLEQDPAFRCFLLDGQAVVLDDYAAIRPDRRDALAALVSSGRVLTGPWYVLADELLSSDECLVRNLLAGRRVAESFGGVLALGYSPDAFGHPAALPTILAGFGIRFGILWRGYGGEQGQDGDLFRWRGPDGAEVVFHHLPPPGYEAGSGMPADPARLHAWWRERLAMLASRAAGRPLLLTAGADHHAAERDLPARLRELARSAPETDFRIASPLEYFDAVASASDLPEARGEHRFSYRYTWTLQGVHSTRASIKRLIAEGDALLVRWAEPQAALSPSAGIAARRAVLDAAWRDHLLGHPHDSICGCVTDDVARDIRNRASGVIVQARGVLVDALHDRLGQDRSAARRDKSRWQCGLVVVNPRPGQASGVVETTVTVFEDDVVVGGPDRRVPARPQVQAPRLVGPDGRVVPMQILGEYDAFERLDSLRDYPDQDRVRAYRVAIQVQGIPPFGTRWLRVANAPVAKPASPVSLKGSSIHGAGGVVQPGDPDGFRFSAAHGGFALAELVSERDEGDTYTWQPVKGDRAVAGRWDPPRVVAAGPLIAAIARDTTVAARARATITARVDAGSSLVRFVIAGENLAGNHRLRVILRGLTGGDSSAVADMQFGPVTRRRAVYPAADFPREQPVQTAPVHRYVSTRNMTVFIRGSYEYELLPDGGIAVTLVRAVGEFSRGDLSARVGHAAWPSATPDAQEPGPFRVELAVAPVGVHEDASPGEWDAVERFSEEFHAPLAGLMLRYGIAVPLETAGPELRGAGLAFKALKPVERGTGVIARCVNLTGESVQGAWRWHRPLRRARLVRLDETPLEEIGITAGGMEIPFTAPPRSVVTILVEAAE